MTSIFVDILVSHYNKLRAEDVLKETESTVSIVQWPRFQFHVERQIVGCLVSSMKNANAAIDSSE